VPGGGDQPQRDHRGHQRGQSVSPGEAHHPPLLSPARQPHRPLVRAATFTLPRPTPCAPRPTVPAHRRSVPLSSPSAFRPMTGHQRAQPGGAKPLPSLRGPLAGALRESPHRSSGSAFLFKGRGRPVRGTPFMFLVKCAATSCWPSDERAMAGNLREIIR
jgi:hypothetical protein